MKFRDYFNVKQILFAVSLFALALIFAYCESGKVVTVDFTDSQLEVRSDVFSMTVSYDEIVSAELVDTPKDDEPIDGVETLTLYYRTWKNEQWGEYTACIDFGSPKSIMLKLTDGQTYVFSSKNTKTTTEIYEELLTHIG